MRDTKAILILLAILVFLALGFVLRLLEAILLPLVIAVFLSQIFTPLTAALRKRRVPEALSIVLVLVLVSAVLFVFSWIVYSSVESFLAALPRYQTRLAVLLRDVSENLGAAFPQIRTMQWQKAVEMSSVTGFLAAGVGSFLLFFNDMFLILLFLIFLLAGSDSFPAKLSRAFAPGVAERVGTVIRNIEAQVRRYLVTKTVVNLINGLLVTLLLAAFGVDFPIFWGFLSFLAHYIPNVGSVLSVGLPAVFFFLQFESPGRALLVTLLNLALQVTIGNAIEPRVMGSSLDLSPLLVLLSLIFWGWLWGGWGMVLAVPMTSTIKIICENVEPLRPIAVLMSAKAPPA